jgi:hypothetical protein
MSAPGGPLPDRDRLRAARALHHWWGIDRVRLNEAGYRFSQEHLSSPLYDPIDDEVAVARAFAGDRAVYATLTHYEKVRVRNLVRAEMDTPEPDLSGCNLAQWCRRVGEDADMVRRFIQRARAKDRKAAALG